MRAITQAALDLIARNEGIKLIAYRDIAGIPTIGVGHTPARMGERITKEQALDYLRADVGIAASAVEIATRDVPTSDDQFSAMASLTFNIGRNAFRGSTVLRQHRAGNYAAAANAFRLWDKAHVDGALVVVPALLRRRNEERAMYLMSVASAGEPVPAAARRSSDQSAPEKRDA